jgi:hypothetical protein
MPVADGPGTDPLAQVIDSLAYASNSGSLTRRADELLAALDAEHRRLLAILCGPRRPWWRRCDQRGGVLNYVRDPDNARAAAVPENASRWDTA